VSLKVVLTTPACPLTGRIEADIRAALVDQVPGVETSPSPGRVTSLGARGLPGRQEIPGVKNIVAVSAGKGGVADDGECQRGHRSGPGRCPRRPP